MSLYSPGVSNRFAIAFLSFVGLLICVGYRTCFALVVTHITSFNVSFHGSTDKNGSSDGLFGHCSSHRDRQVAWSGSTTFLFHAAFFMGQLVASVPAAALASRFPPKWLFGGAVLISSILFVVLPEASELSDVPVFIIRTLQGVVEAIAVPAMNAFVSSVAPKTERAKLINIVYAGVYLSPAVAMFTTGATTCFVSWDSMMYIYGGLGTIWSVLWLVIVEKNPRIPESPGPTERTRLLHTPKTHDRSTTRQSSVPWCKMITSLPLLSVWVACFCRNFVFAMLITEVQQYYKDVYHLSTAMIGLLSAMPYVFMPAAMVPISCLFDTLAKRNVMSLTKIRKLAQFAGDSVQGACFVAIGFVDDHITTFILLCVGVTFSAFAMSGFQTNPLDLAPQYVGAISGIIRTGMIGSVCSTVLASQLTGHSHSLTDWQHMFIIAGSINLGGLVFYLVFASGNVQPWAVESRPSIDIVQGMADAAIDNGSINNSMPSNGIFDKNANIGDDKSILDGRNFDIY